MIKVSISDLLYFNQCRRSWLWGKTWAPKEPNAAFWLGAGVHQGMEAFFKTKATKHSIAAIDRWADVSFEKMSKGLGILWPTLRERFTEARGTAVGILTNWGVYWEDARPALLDCDVVAVESYLRQPLIEGEVELTGKLDLILRDRRDRIIIIDHKTTSRGLSSEAMEVDQQLTGYAYLYWKKFGVIPSKLGYNIIYKAVPELPTELKRSGLSRAKDQPTNGRLYREALDRLKLDHAEYADYLNYLDTEGWSIFFAQYDSTRTQKELEAFELRSRAKAREIQRVLKNPDVWGYPEPSIYNCGNCPFVIPCKLADEGEDYEFLLKERFTTDSLY